MKKRAHTETGSWIGQALERVDADAKLSGRCRYLADLRFDGLLHAAQACSSQPHARLLGLDLEAARSMPGVRAVLGPGDLPGRNRVGVILDDQPLLAVDRVRYLGEPLAIVAADSEQQAMAAARVLETSARYETLPAVFGLDDISALEQARIHERGPVATEQMVNKGDVAAGFAAADELVEAEFFTGAQEHYYLETQVCVALPEDDGGLRILASLQCPFYVQKAVARVTGLSLARVRVIQTPSGGAFGGKEDLPNEYCARAAVLALATGRPVRLLLDRRRDVAGSSKRHPFRSRGRLGATRDGLFTAIEIRHDADSGAYATLSPPVIYRAAIQGAGPYEIPHVHMEARGWYSNNVPNGAFRGFGSPQATFVHERLVDLMAERLGLDPVELRRRNLLHEGGLTATGQLLSESVGASETLERCAKAAALQTGSTTARQTGPAVSSKAVDGKNAGPADGGGHTAGTGPSTTPLSAEGPSPADIVLAPELAEDPARWLVGTGFASMIYGNCLGKAGWHMDGAGAYLQLRADGSLSCSTGLTEIGQGSQTVVTQMAADAVGVEAADVVLTPIDTALVPDSGPTVASRNVVMSGNAILAAGDKLRRRLLPLAAELIGAPETELSLQNGQVLRGGKPVLSMAELAGEAWRRNLNLAAEGWWHVPELDFDAETGLGEAYFAYSFATQAARVAVDTLSGQVRVLKVWAAHDVGRAVNPAGVEGQVEGGVVQGMGWALGERYVAEGGRVLSDNLSTYELPRSIDSPEIETIIVESPHSDCPHGAKSLGEPVIIPIAAAIANAVARATGARIVRLPLEPEQILTELEK